MTVSMMRRFKISLHLVAALLPAAAPLRAQTAAVPVWQEAGVPYLQNFSPQEYQATPQNWCLAQDENGVIYAGNYGVLIYDGVSWQRIPINDTAVRSLAIAPGRIYLGAQRELGYLAADAIGRLRYVSLRDSIPAEHREFQDVWRTLVIGDDVYFQTFDSLLRWRNGRMKVWRPKDRFHLAFAVQDTLFVRVPGEGLMKLEADSLRLVGGGEMFANRPLLTMLPLEPGKALLGTLAHGLFVYDGRTITPFPTAAETFLREQQLYHATVLPEGFIALATLRGGVAIIDRQGNLCQVVNKAAGLRDDRVHFVHADRRGGLWLALNNGLAHVEVPSPFSRFAASANLASTVEHLLRHAGSLYAATHRGVLRLLPADVAATAAPAAPRFAEVPGIATHSWYLLDAGEDLLAATDDGVYQIQPGRATLLNTKWSGATCLWRSQQDSSLVWVGLYEGLAALRRSAGQWHDLGRLQGINEMIVSITATSEGELWLGTQFEGVLRVDLKAATAALQSGALQAPVTRYGEAHGLPNTRISAARIAGRILFATQKGLRRFEAAAQRFLPDSTFGAAFADTSCWIFRMQEDANAAVWLIAGRGKQALNGRALPQADGTYRWQGQPFARLHDLGDVFSIYPEADGTIWFGGAEGVARYAPQIAVTAAGDFPALIRRVSTISPQTDSIFFHGGRPPDFPPRLDYPLNSLRFDCAAASFEPGAANQFQFLLAGFDRAWSNWTSETKKDYTGLREGDYVFRVRARNLYGQESREARFAFTVLPPWYRSWWAYGGYLALLAAGVFVVDRTQRARLIKKEQQKAALREAEITLQKNFELHQKNGQLQRVLQDLQQAQNHLSRSESRFRSVAESANDAIITTDRTGKIMYWNRRAQTIFGYSESEALGQSLAMLMPERYRAQHNRGMQRFFTTGERNIIGRVVEMHAIRKDGREFPIELSVAAWQTDEGQFVTGIIRDITKRRQAEAELERTQALLAEENWRKSEELEKARQLQLAMLPQEIPQLPHLEIDAYMKTATEVGGDYYDFHVGADGTLNVVIGDATGHGLNAGMMVTATKSILTTLRHETDLVSVFKQLNAGLKRVNLPRHYMALQILRCTNSHFEVCSAGMPPVLHYRAATGEIEEISLKAMPLGSSYEFPYQQRTVPLAPGDTILLMSDGFPELFNPAGELFEYERVKATFAGVATLAPPQIIEHFVRTGEQWAGRSQQHDDVTFIALKARG